MSNNSTEIPLTELNIPQLNQLSQQLDQELELMQNSLSQLKVVQTKFSESLAALGKVTAENVDKEILVPLTCSMYVSGKMADPEHVLIDIGTGYFVEKSVASSKQFFKRKVDYLMKQMETIQPVLQEKFKMKQVLVEVLQMKVQAQVQSQSAPAIAVK